MQERNANELLKKYKDGTCTEEEMTLLRNWFHSFNEADTADLTAQDLEQATTAMWAVIQERKQVSRTVPLWKYAAAAAIVLLLGAGAWSFFYRPVVIPLAVKTTDSIPVLPGGQRALLTLANGATIALSDTAAGEIARQQGVHVSQTAGGQLIYTTPATAAADTAPLVYNTISTPRGGQFQVHLPDGSKVWLNTASSLRYPPRFGNRERSVELTGEAYFEVNADKERPFFVVTAQQKVAVLGTHFNITAYPDVNTTTTTLLTGSIRISGEGTATAILKPGQQAVMDKQIRVSAVDPAEAVAWKSGYLLFDNEDFTTIMGRIARWYDMEIEYQATPRRIKLGGRVSLSRKLPDVLSALETAGHVHFRLTGRKIIVME